MDKVYDFNWLVDDIDSSIVFCLYRGDELLSAYQVHDISFNGIVKANVKFANTHDLSQLITSSFITFESYNDRSNIIQIPIFKLYMLFEDTPLVGDNRNKMLNLSDISAFSVYDNKVIGEGYQLSIRKINMESEELARIMQIAKNYPEMGMQEKFDALNEVNLVNYHRSVENDKSK